MERLALAFDLGGTRLRAALVTAQGEIKNHEEVATDVAGGPAAITVQMQALARQLGSTGKINTVGIACPGPLDSSTGITLGIATLPGWTNFPLRQTIAEEFSLPTILENDGISAAFGEWTSGAGQGCSNMVFVTISTGIGGGVIVDGNILHGARGMAGHVGHMMIAQQGPACGCGGVGCFEALASGTALSARARAKGFASAAIAVEQARTGNAIALALVEEEATYLGYGFASLLHLYSPERLVIGGGVAQALDLMRNRIHQEIQRLAMPAFRDVQILAAKLGDRSGIVGAARLAFQNLDVKSKGEIQK